MTRALDGPAPGEPRGGPVQAAGAAIVATGLDGTIQSFNPAAERLTGYSAADLIGTHSITMLHLEGELRRRGDALSEARGRETASLLEALVAPARRSGAETRAWTYERVDGLPVRVLVTTSVARDDEGALAGFVFVSQPTSEPPSRRGDAVLLGQLVDSSRVAIMSASLDGYVLSWNAAAARLLGYDREEILGQHVGVLFPTERRHEIVSMLRRLLQEEDALVLETTRVRKDGERVAVQLRLSPVLDGDGVPLGVSIIALPRERPRGGPPSGSTENARYRALFESSASFAAIVGVDGFFKAFNPIWSSVFGFSERELRAQPVLERVHPEDRARTVLAGRSLVTDGAPLLNVRARFLCAGGGHRWLSWNANPDLEAGLIYAIAHDITELVETRERLRESERQLLETGRIARLGGWELDVATGRVHWSDVVRQIHEVPPDFEPTLERALEFYAEEERPRIYAAVQRAVAEGESWDAELAFTSARGRSMWVRAKAEAERERPDGRVLRVRGTLQDITERKELDRLKDEFVSVVSHELRTPLTSIRGALRLIEGGLTGPVAGETMTLVKVASSNCERLVGMINDILDLDRIEHGSLRLSRATVDVGGLIQQAAREQSALAASRGVAITTAVPPGLRALGDRERLLQVLGHLLSNAIKFSSSGTTVRVVGGASSSGGARVSVIDRGAGIPESERTRVFEKFRQLDASDTRRAGGTGLGLAICKGLIALHGGRIGVESALGEGSAFWFELPSP